MTVAQYTMPIYLMHPFITKIVGAVLDLTGIYYSLINLPAIIVVVPIITIFLKKIKLVFLLE